jgi:membrane-associated phospholipid phosphatase
MRWLVVAVFLLPLSARAATCRVASAPAERAAFATSVGVYLMGAGLFTAGEVREPAIGDGSWQPGIDASVPETLQEGPALVSDVLLISGVSLGMVGSGLHAGACGKRGATAFAWATPFVEGMGGMFFTYGVNNVVKKSVGRPRPYTRSGLTLDTDDYESFFSGHSSLSAWGFGHATAEALRFTELPWHGRAGIGFGAGLGAGLGVGSLRVAAGKHYWSDVLVGVVWGATTSTLPTLLDPVWNRMGNKKLALRTEVGPQGAQVALSGSF